MPLEVPMFEQLRDVILECVQGLDKMVTAMQSLSGMSLGGDIQFGLVNFHAQGTVGKAFAKGTGKYKGLPSSEKNALRSEYGQPELTVYPDGTTELTTEPTMSDLPKGTVIFNEEQTHKILNNSGKSVSGKSFADGTITLSNGTTLTPIQPEDSGYKLVKIAEQLKSQMVDNMIPSFDLIGKNVEM